MRCRRLHAGHAHFIGRVDLIDRVIARKREIGNAACRVGLGPAARCRVVVAFSEVVEAVGYVTDSRVATGGVVAALEVEEVVCWAVGATVPLVSRRMGRNGRSARAPGAVELADESQTGG